MNRQRRIRRSKRKTGRSRVPPGLKPQSLDCPKRRPEARHYPNYLVVHAVHECPQLARTRGMTQLAQRLGLNLADAFARDCERLAHFLERVLGAVLQAEAHFDHLLLAGRERAQHLRRLLLKVDVDHRFRRRNHGAIFDEVAQMRIFFFADGRLQRNRLLSDLEHLAHLGHRNVHALGDLFRGRLAAQLLHQLPRSANQLVNGLDHVHRNADGARLIGDCAGDGLANPPRRIGRELIAAAVFELVHGLHQADVALLNQVEELQAAIGVLLGDGHHQPQVGFDQLPLGVFGVHVALHDFALGALQFGEVGAGIVLHALQVGPNLPHLLAQFFLGFLGACLIGALLEVHRLLVEPAHAVDGLVDPVDQALALVVGKAKPANDSRYSNLLASQRPTVAAVLLRPFLLRNIGQLFDELDRLLVVPAEFVNLPGDVLQAIEDHLFRDLLFVEEHHFFDGAHAALEVLADGNDFANYDRRARQRFEYTQLPALDALGDLDFAFAGEQRDRAHLTQVHANRVVGFFQSARRKVEFNVLARFQFGIELLIERAGELRTFEHINALRADGGQQILEVIGRMQVVRDKVVDLVVSEVALFFSRVDQFFDVGELIFKSQSGVSSKLRQLSGALLVCTPRRERYCSTDMRRNFQSLS